MSNIVFLTFIFSAILAIMLFTGLVKTAKFNFPAVPTIDTRQSEDIQQSQSEKAADLQEKNRQLMDRVKAQMEKNRH